MPDAPVPAGTTYVGTSGWHYRHWRKVFYPAELPQDGWLGFYAESFSCVEVNASFYRLPTQSAIEGWCAAVPETFRFAVKAPRVITHYKKLKACENELQVFLTRLNVFGSRLGPILFQLPPHWRCNTRRLRDFLRQLKGDRRYVFELRDVSWHCDEVLELLEEHGVAWCVFELDGMTSPFLTTTGFAYVRLHGPSGAYSGSYPAHALRGWAGRALRWNHKGKDVYVFFDNDERGFAPRNARRAQGFVAEGATHPGTVVTDSDS